MSAPKLPVVAAWVWEDGGEENEAFCRTRYPDERPEDGDLPAVALPWALLEDVEFRLAVTRRLMDTMRVVGEGFIPFAMFDALAAELRARAGGGV